MVAEVGFVFVVVLIFEVRWYLAMGTPDDYCCRYYYYYYYWYHLFSRCDHRRPPPRRKLIFNKQFIKEEKGKKLVKRNLETK